MPDLEERVAALEAALLHPLGIIDVHEALTEEQAARLKEDFDAAMKDIGHQPLRILPSLPPLTPDQVRCLLRECVTVVKPGETLIVRVPLAWEPEQVDRYTRDIGEVSEAMELPFKTVVVAADELARAEPGGIPGAS